MESLKNLSPVEKILAGCTTVLAICAFCTICFFAVGILAPSQDRTEVAEQPPPVVEPTATSEPSATPLPTSTPEPTPIPTLVVTDTPIPEITGDDVINEKIQSLTCDEAIFLARQQERSAYVDLEQTSLAAKTVSFKEGFAETEYFAHKKLLEETARVLRAHLKITLDINN